MPPRKKDESSGEQSEKWIGGLIGFVSIVIVMIRTFGWAGATLILGLFSINLWASTEQKQRIIESYILGTGISSRYPLVITCVVFLIVLFAQHKWYSHDKERLKAEIDRKEKTILELQQLSVRKRVR